MLALGTTSSAKRVGARRKNRINVDCVCTIDTLANESQSLGGRTEHLHFVFGICFDEEKRRRPKLAITRIVGAKQLWARVCRRFFVPMRVRSYIVGPFEQIRF